MAPRDGTPSVEKLETQVDDILKQLDEVIKLHASPGEPESDDADATGSGKDNAGGYRRRPLKHDQQVKNMDKAKSKAADAEGDGDEDDMGKALSAMEKVIEKAKSKKSDDTTDDDEEMTDDWSAGSKDKTKKRAESSSEDDESVTIGGQDILKSEVGEAQFAIFKGMNERLEKAQEEIQKHKDEAEMANLRKRADDEFAFLPGTTDERANVLKSVNGLSKDVRKSLETILTTANKLAKSAFGKIGVGGGDNSHMQKTAASFDAKVSEIKKRDGCSRTDALEKARKEDPDGFKAFQGQN